MCCFFNDSATTEIYALSLHDALPIWLAVLCDGLPLALRIAAARLAVSPALKVSELVAELDDGHGRLDRKSTRLNSSHANISYAVFCLKTTSSSHRRQAISTTASW